MLEIIRDRIAHYLVFGGQPHLCDCLFLVCDEHLPALYEMYSRARDANVPKPEVARRVCDDIAAYISGRPDLAVYSGQYLRRA
ncbi:hypothetical protein GCM10023093_17320 [Nemorincola caseinilytica]|uniref:Uncharacterized protein n=1 Tax=Nemorincola caseinilytica TaxID=2054315 RepID=A0ABP8NGX3_9BACT